MSLAPCPATGRPRRTASTTAAADPLLHQQPTATAATEIVKAARAYLQDPTRPVTPACAASSGRHLLQSSSGYSNRPQTSHNSVASHDFRSAAAADGICWASSSGGGQADIWVAEAETPTAAGQLLPSVRRATASAPSLHPLPSVAGNLRAGTAGSSSRACTASSSGSRLAGLGSLAPLRRPATTTAKAAPADALPAARAAAGDPDAGLGAVAAASSAELCVWRCSSPNAACSEAWPVPAAETSSCYEPAAREASTSTESSSIIRPGSAGGGGPSSRGSTAGSCRSRASERPSVRDSLAAAEAELDEMLLEADTAGGEARTPQAAARQDAAAACRQWRWDALRILRQVQALSLSPTDAPALLQHCSDLQCLLATAADNLQDWLSTAPAQTAAGAAGQLQPCVSRSLTSSRHLGSGSLQEAVGTDLHTLLLQTLVRLVDSKKPDVLVKVGAMLLGVTPSGSSMLLPAAKMLYGLSKDSSNDSRFRHHGVLRPLLQMTAALSAAVEQQRQQQHTGTALLYCSGCLKNVSADAANQKSLGRLGGVSTMAQVLFDQVSVATAVASAQQQQRQQALRQQQPSSRHPQHETAAQVCMQASAVLRNLAVAEANAALFVQQQGLALRALISLLQPFQQDAEVLLNVSRCLSKLSMYDSCRQALVSSGAQQGVSCSSPAEKSGSGSGSESESGSESGSGSGSSSSSSSAALSAPHTPVALIARALMSTQATQPKQWPAGVRLAFALGQLTAYHPQSQLLLASVPGVLDALPGLVLDLVQYSQQQHSQQQQQPSQGQQQQQQQQQSRLQPQQAQGQLPPAEDLVTKLLRVLANLAIDRTVGPALAAKQTTADALVAVLTGYEYEAAEELVLNAVAALTNLAFYDSPSNKVLQLDADVLLMALLPLLTSGSEESMREAAQAVGNLARASPAVRAALVLCFDGAAQQQGSGPPAAADDGSSSGGACMSAGPYVLQSLVLLLGHGSWEVLNSVAGAFVNLCALAEAGSALSRAGLAPALADVLQRVQDWWGLAQQLQDEQLAGDEEVCMQAGELMLQCAANMAAASATAMSDAILGSGGPRCADLSCSSEDLARFSSIARGLAGDEQVPGRIAETARVVQSRLASLWGM